MKITVGTRTLMWWTWNQQIISVALKSSRFFIIFFFFSSNLDNLCWFMFNPSGSYYVILGAHNRKPFLLFRFCSACLRFVITRPSQKCIHNVSHLPLVLFNFLKKNRMWKPCLPVQIALYICLTRIYKTINTNVDMSLQKRTKKRDNFTGCWREKKIWKIYFCQF